MRILCILLGTDLKTEGIISCIALFCYSSQTTLIKNSANLKSPPNILLHGVNRVNTEKENNVEVVFFGLFCVGMSV